MIKDRVGIVGPRPDDYRQFVSYVRMMEAPPAVCMYCVPQYSMGLVMVGNFG
jgi:hypothetical protein